VHSGDVVLIPYGWHGPSMAAPGYHLYYLNVMAGPGAREWRVRDDPAHGWHGPSIAAPGHHLYYLNVMAGPGAERAWRIVDDPEHSWIRGTWADEDVDPRLPLTSPPADPTSQNGATRP